MSVRRFSLPLVLCVLLGVACSSGGGDVAASGSHSPSPSTPPPTAVSVSPSVAPPSPIVPSNCKPHGTKLQLTIQSLTFDSKCLAVTSGVPFTVAVDNTSKDFAANHNFSIYSAPDGQGELFRGDLITSGSSKTYHVDALGPGVFYFRCDIHPQLMKGLFVVR